MAKKEGVQKRLQKVCPPRVQLMYDVEIGDAIETKELPFMMGVVADLLGQSEAQQPKFRDRKFVNVDRDNFDEAMKSVEPRTVSQVPNTPTEDGGRFGVDLKFRSFEDFSPEAVVEQVEPLHKLLETCSRLAGLRSKMADNDKLEDLLSEVLKNTENVKKLGAKQNGGEDA